MGVAAASAVAAGPVVGCRRRGRSARRASLLAGAIIAVSVGAWWAGDVAEAAPPPVGALTQLPGQLGCISIAGNSEDGTGTCGVGRAIDGAESVTVSPDGMNLYVGSYKKANEPGLSVFSRDPLTGTLTQLAGTPGCLTADGASQAGPGTCTRVRALTSVGDGRDLAFTSDGRWAYLALQEEKPNPPGVLLFQRDPSTGVLTQLAGTAGCITVNGSSQDGPGTCQTDPTLVQPNGLTISSDNRFVYVTDYNLPNSRVHVFARNPTTGELSEAQCLRISPSSPGCGVARVIGDDEAFMISPNGLHAYSGAFPSNGISIFDRDPATGLLTQKAGTAGCITDTGEDDTKAPTCAMGRGLGGAWVVTMSPDGNTLYVTSYTANGIAIFHVNGDGSLSQLPGTEGCISLTGSSNAGPGTCAVGRALSKPYLTTISPDGRTLYVTEESGGTPGGVAIFSLNPATGGATQLPGLLGCVTTDGSSNGSPNVCTDGTALAGTYSVAVSPNGTSAYLASNGAQALSVFSRETGPACNTVIASTVAGTPIAVKLSCADADGQPVTFATASGPSHGTLGAINQATGSVTYTPAAGFSGSDGFVFTASDGTNESAQTTASIAVTPAPFATPIAALLPPVLSSVSETAKTWREGNALAHISTKKSKKKLPVGTTFSFSLNEPASVSFAFTQQLAGNKVKGKCLAKTKKNRKKPPCTRTVTQGTLAFKGHTGMNKVSFQGRISASKKLRLGRYRLLITATNAAGQRSQTQSLSFTIVK